MFGYVRPNKSELLVREYEQYKAIYCQLCRELGKSFGWLARFTLSYDCTFYAMLALSVGETTLRTCKKRCAANPLKRCTYLEATGEGYEKAAALCVILTYYKLRDDGEDEGFWKARFSRFLAALLSRKAKRAGAKYPFLEDAARTAMNGQREAEQAQLGLDPCAQPTAELLAVVFQELSTDPGERAALERFGYFMGRWIYLMDASDDLLRDMKQGAFNPFIRRLGLEGKKELTGEERQEAEIYCNQALNAAAAQMVLALNLIHLENFGPIVENVVQKGLPEIQREILFLHVRDRKRRGRP